MSKNVRIEAIDLFRAATMLLMIFVNDLWSLTNIPHWMGHAAVGEDMFGFSDVIFPSFLFAVGLSIPFAVTNRRAKGDSTLAIAGHIVVRSLSLIVMGLFMVNYEFWGRGGAEGVLFDRSTWKVLMIAAFFLIFMVYPRRTDWMRWLPRVLQATGVALLALLYFNYGGKEPFAPHWWGILGLIGWTYGICALTYLFIGNRLWWTVGVLVGAFVLTMVASSGLWRMPIPSLGSNQSLTMAGIVTALLIVRGDKRLVAKCLIIGAVMLAAGFVAHNFWIINKIGATPTWGFFSLAVCFPAFGLVWWVTEVRGSGKWLIGLLRPAAVATLTCYMIPYIFPAWTASMLPEWAVTGATGLAKSMIYSCTCIAIVWGLMKIKIRLKI